MQNFRNNLRMPLLRSETVILYQQRPSAAYSSHNNIKIIFKTITIRWITSKEFYRHRSLAFLRKRSAKTIALQWKVRFNSLRTPAVIFRQLWHRICQLSKSPKWPTHWTYSAVTPSKQRASSKSTWYIRWTQRYWETWRMSTTPWMEAFLKRELMPKVPKESQSNLSYASQRLMSKDARSKSLRRPGSAEINTSSSLSLSWTETGEMTHHVWAVKDRQWRLLSLLLTCIALLIWPWLAKMESKLVALVQQACRLRPRETT